MDLGEFGDLLDKFESVLEGANDKNVPIYILIEAIISGEPIYESKVLSITKLENTSDDIIRRYILAMEKRGILQFGESDPKLGKLLILDRNQTLSVLSE